MCAAHPYRYLFGPVPSRRLGRSLGIDIVPFKSCTLDCIYCECGATTALIDAAPDDPSLDTLTNELERFAAGGEPFDVLTITGSGEPTLNPALGSLISRAKKIFPGRHVALLTNSTLFFHPDVRARVMACDLILPSLDAVSHDVFEKINRPVATISAAQVVDGLISLAAEYTGALWVEVFIVPGINDTAAEIDRIRDVLTAINPQRVQLNTLDRPGTCDWVTPASPHQLETIAARLLPLPVEIISRNTATHVFAEHAALDVEALCSAMKRRPATIEDLCRMSGATLNSVQHLMERLCAERRVCAQRVGITTFYRAL